MASEEKNSLVVDITDIVTPLSNKPGASAANADKTSAATAGANSAASDVVSEKEAGTGAVKLDDEDDPSEPASGEVSGNLELNNLKRGDGDMADKDLTEVDVEASTEQVEDAENIVTDVPEGDSAVTSDDAEELAADAENSSDKDVAATDSETDAEPGENETDDSADALADDASDSGEESQETSELDSEEHDGEQSEPEEKRSEDETHSTDEKHSSALSEALNSGEVAADVDPEFAEKVTQSVQADTSVPQAENLENVTAEKIVSQTVDYEQPEISATPERQPLSQDEGRRSMVPIEAMPVTLTFETGRHKITVGELEKLKEGYTFECGNPIEAPVTICANDLPIGIGELVDVDGRIGVRVIKFDNNK